MSNTKVNVNNGVGVSSLLGILFITLKLTNIIQWSWWWVLAPFWIPTAFLVMSLVVVLILAIMINK